MNVHSNSIEQEMARTCKDDSQQLDVHLHASWEQLSPRSRSPLETAISAEETEDDETRPLISKKIEERRKAEKKKLSLIFGVTIPCILSIFSVVLFLRLGFVLGQAGFWQTVLMIIVGYGVVVLTVLSISAIATSSTVEGGGVYFMISRALGPEFGGSVGIIFFVANVFASASYIIGFVEALGSNLGEGGTLLSCGEDCGLPVERWYNFAYGTLVLFFCLIVCLIGAGLFAKTTFIIFCAVMVSLASVVFSFGYEGEKNNIPVPRENRLFFRSHNSSEKLVYTSWSWDTFRDNLHDNYIQDYTNVGEVMTFQYVFSIMFNGCTGIMAGANISGDLKNPSVAIPMGTLLACGITFIVYAVLFTFSAFTCSRLLMLNNYNYLQYINALAPMITIGVFAATLSAALSTLIGASRVLQALAKDRLFSGVLHPFTWTWGKNKEPLPAVLFSWFIVQITLFLGRLNSIAPIVTMFFLVSYGVVNLACFALKIASAPNFRPTFQVYARYTSALGALACIVMMFYINPAYAGATIAIMILIFVYLLIRGPATPWGDVSQALIYHQVRKYLLRLDIRKSHVKFWRPEILLMVSNPRSAYNLIEFTNDLKKGGLFVLGHVIPQPFTTETAHYHSEQLRVWLTFVEISKIKAFVEITLSPSVRAGAQGLLSTAGLGGMKPNTLALGFYSADIPKNCLDNLYNKLLMKPKAIRYAIRDTSLEKFDTISAELPELRTTAAGQELTPEEYVAIIQDAVTMGKNVCIMRHFENFDKRRQLKDHPCIDVWPLRVRYHEGFDDTFMLVLQLACVLHMKQEWKSHTKIRIFVIIENDMGVEREILHELLKETRIDASVQMITPPANFHFGTFTESFTTGAAVGRSLQYHKEINNLMQQYSHNASIVFTSLPPIPSDLSRASDFIQDLDILSANAPPIVAVFGNMPVMSTTLA